MYVKTINYSGSYYKVTVIDPVTFLAYHLLAKLGKNLPPRTTGSSASLTRSPGDAYIC